MATDWKKLIKPASKAAASGSTLTPTQKIAANMDKAMAAYKSGEVAKRANIKAVGDKVQFSVRFANQAIELAPGITIAEIPAVQFEGVYEAIKKSALAGEFDTQLAPLAEKAKARGQRLAGTPRKARAKK